MRAAGVGISCLMQRQPVKKAGNTGSIRRQSDN
jgi:hypothetical protein